MLILMKFNYKIHVELFSTNVKECISSKLKMIFLSKGWWDNHKDKSSKLCYKNNFLSANYMNNNY
jgi:hypothetical protein